MIRPLIGKARGPWRSATVDLLLISLIGYFVIAAGYEYRRKANQYTPAPLRGGDELLFVFVASSSCPGIRAPDLPRAVAALKEQYRQVARSDSVNFATLAISLDRSLSQGMDTMERFGPWDEITIGRSWLNAGALKYIWQDVPGGSAIPQVLLVRRNVQAGMTFRVEDERVLVRRAGAQAIVDWSNAKQGITSARL